MNKFQILIAFIILAVMQSCTKKDSTGEVIEDHFTYGKKINFVEDSIRTGNGSWTKIASGNTFSWLSNGQSFNQNSFAVYPKTTNIKTSFDYIIEKDSVIAFQIASDSLYFTDANKARRTDVKGKIVIKTDTTLILNNTGVTPAVSIIYKLKNSLWSCSSRRG
jgi:hypothetical protein